MNDGDRRSEALPQSELSLFRLDYWIERLTEVLIERALEIEQLEQKKEE